MYRTAVSEVNGAVARLRLIPEQPDCMPFYVSNNFAAGTLWYVSSALRAAYPDHDRWSALASRGGELGDRLVKRVKLARLHNWPWHHGDDPPAPDVYADYEIEVTDPRWLGGVAIAAVVESYAYDFVGPYLRCVVPRPSVSYWCGGDAGLGFEGLVADPDVLRALRR